MQSESGSLAGWLGGEEWIEDPHAQIGPARFFQNDELVAADAAVTVGGQNQARFDATARGQEIDKVVGLETPDAFTFRVKLSQPNGAFLGNLGRFSGLPVLPKHVLKDVPPEELCAAIRADPKTRSYWSIALYAANSDNFFVVNDRQAGGRPVDLVLVGPTRDDAADKQIAALDAFEIEGLGHNVDFAA